MNFAKRFYLFLCLTAAIALFALAPKAVAKNPWNATSDGTESQNAIRFQFFESQYGKYIPYAKPKSWGGFAEYDPVTGAPKPGYVYGSWFEANTPIPLYTRYPATPMSAFFNFPTDTKVEEGRYKHVMMPAMGDVLTDTQHQAHLTKIVHDTVANLTDPGRLTDVAMSTQQAQASSLGNAMGETARDQAASAIDFCSKYLFNFTADGGNIWNRVRNELFVPIGILLLLPGAVLSQVRAVAAAGNPVLGEVNPFDGILRSFIAIFLIPGTYLIVNYGIDLSNSITLTIAGEYNRMFNSDMYKDAVCGEIRATPVRQPSENKDHYDVVTAGMGPLLGSDTSRGLFEGRMIETKSEDPCSNINKAPRDRVDEAVSSGVVATRLLGNTINAGLTASWNILCAFMMAYLMYLFFVGPVVAGLWVWPMKQLRDALPNWIEGTLTLCFWSLFWNTVILIMACLKGVDETGTIMFSALNFLATASVKYAFDFAGLVKAAGQQAGQQAQSGAGAGGAAGGAGAGHSASRAHGAGGAATAAAPEAGAAPAQPGGPAEPNSHWSPSSYSWIQSGDGGPGESGDARAAGGTFNNASTVPGVAGSSTPGSTPNGNGNVPVDAGVPPLVTSANPERVLLPNGDFVTLMRHPGSTTTGVMDSSGNVVGSFESGNDGSSYVRLMNGDLLQVVRDGDGENFFLNSRDGAVSQPLRHGTFEGHSLVMPHVATAGSAGSHGTAGSAGSGGSGGSGDSAGSSGAPASGDSSAVDLTLAAATADLNGDTTGGDPTIAAVPSVSSAGGPGASNGAANSTLLAAHAASAHSAAVHNPGVIIPTSAGPMFVSNHGGHGTATLPGSDGVPQTYAFDEDHSQTINLPDGDIVTLSMAGGMGNVSIDSPLGTNLSSLSIGGDSMVSNAGLIYGDDGGLLGTSATSMAMVNGTPMDTTVYRDTAGDIVGYHSANHYGAGQPGTWYDGNGVQINPGDNHSHLALNPVLAQAIDAGATGPDPTQINPAPLASNDQYTLAMESAGDVVSPLNTLLDPIFASAPSWPGDVSTTYNSALPADSGTMLASNMTFPTETLARASSFSPDPNVAPLLNTTLPLSSGAPAIAFSNSSNVNPFSTTSSAGFDSPGVAAAPSVANHADSAGVSIVSNMPDASYQPTQFSSNLRADSIVPTNWSSSDAAVGGSDVVAQQQAMQSYSQPSSSLQKQISSTSGVAANQAAPVPQQPYMSNPPRPQQFAKLPPSTSFSAPNYGADFFETALAAAALRRIGAVARAKETAGDEPAPQPFPQSPKPVEQLAKTPSETGNRLNSVLGSAGSSRAQSMDAARNLLGRLNIAADPTVASPLSTEHSTEQVSSGCTNCTGLMCTCMGGNRTLAQRFARKSNNVEVAMPPLTSDH